MSGVSLFDAGIIRDLKKTVDEAMQDTCVLYHPTLVETDYGGSSGTAVAYGTVSCHVARAALVTPEFRTNAEQEHPDANWMVLLPRGQAIEDHDIITWSNAYGGGTVAVVERLPRTFELTRRAFCRNYYGGTAVLS